MPDNQSEKIKDRFKKLRNELRLNQSELAERIGIKQAHISAMESGRRNITGDIKLVLQDKFGINRLWLETGDGEMFLQSGVKKPHGAKYTENEHVNLSSNNGNNFDAHEPESKYIVKTDPAVVRVPMHKHIPVAGESPAGYLLLQDVKEGSIAVRVQDESQDNKTDFGTWVIIRLLK